MEFLGIAIAVVISALVLFLAKYYIHMLQLEGYFVSQYLPHLFARIKNPKFLFKPQPAKKPLVFTARIKRLYLCLFIISLLINGVLGIFGKVYLFPLMLLTLVLVSFLVLVASLIMIPVEKEG